MRPRMLLAACALTVVLAPVAFAQVPNAPTGAARDLPSTVLNAFQKAFPAATITGSSQERLDGEIAFRVDALDQGRRRTIVYNLSGSVLEAAEQVDEKDLPKPVAAAVHAHPKAVYVKGMKITNGINVRYELTLRGTRKTTLIVKPDGSVVSFK